MKHNEEIHDEIGDNHISSCATNPLREDAFDITDDRKYKRCRNILLTLGMDLTDDSIKGTPNRVAKMFVKEIFGGLKS
jgi:GTP cyclohydrolase I